MLMSKGWNAFEHLKCLNVSGLYFSECEVSFCYSCLFIHFSNFFICILQLYFVFHLGNRYWQVKCVFNTRFSCYCIFGLEILIYLNLFHKRYQSRYIGVQLIKKNKNYMIITSCVGL